MQMTIVLSVIVILIVLVIIGLFRDSIEKMNFKCIIEEYLDTFYRFDTKEKSQKDIMLFIGFPICLGIVVGNFIFLTRGFIEVLLTIFSILLGLMLNLLILILSKKSKNRQVNTFITELFHSISFSILISIFIVISSLVFSLDVQFVKKISFYLILKKIASIWIYSLIFLFCMDLFIILKRIHILLSKLNDEEEE